MIGVTPGEFRVELHWVFCPGVLKGRFPAQSLA
ncbi:hypothetical protein ABIB49_003726, partial [Arthrobacter sp. UYCu512]